MNRVDRYMSRSGDAVREVNIALPKRDGGGSKQGGEGKDFFHSMWCVLLVLWVVLIGWDVLFELRVQNLGPISRNAKAVVEEKPLTDGNLRSRNRGAGVGVRKPSGRGAVEGINRKPRDLTQVRARGSGGHHHRSDQPYSRGSGLSGHPRRKEWASRGH